VLLVSDQKLSESDQEERFVTLGCVLQDGCRVYIRWLQGVANGVHMMSAVPVGVPGVGAARCTPPLLLPATAAVLLAAAAPRLLPEPSKSHHGPTGIYMSVTVPRSRSTSVG